jgi:hypothetical protein
VDLASPYLPGLCFNCSLFFGFFLPLISISILLTPIVVVKLGSEIFHVSNPPAMVPFLVQGFAYSFLIV